MSREADRRPPSRFITPPAAPLPRYLPSLDGIRAVCILLVVGAHARHGPGLPEAWSDPWEYVFSGGVGVTAFFVLSGFLITHLLLREEREHGEVSLRGFYARRIVRIVPVYLVYVGVVVGLDLWTAMDLSACQYITALTYTKDFGCSGWIDGHLWSLSVEEQFYLFWPAVIVFLPPRMRWGSAGALILAAPLFRTAFYVLDNRHLWLYSFMSNMDSLMIGCVAALVVATWPERVRRFVHLRPTWGRLLAASVIYVSWVAGVREIWGIVNVPFGITAKSTAVAYLVLSYVLVPSGWGYRVLNWGWMRWLGILSYSLYIWQQPFFAAAGAYGADPFFLRFPFNVGAAVAVAALSYYALERPLVGLRRRLRQSTASEPA